MTSQTPLANQLGQFVGGLLRGPKIFALSAPSGMGLSHACQEQAADPRCRYVGFDGCSLRANLPSIIRAIAPVLLAPAPNFFATLGISEIDRTRSWPMEQLTDCLRLAMIHWANHGEPGTRVLIIDNLHRLRGRVALDQLVEKLCDARADLPISFLLVGGDQFVPPSRCSRTMSSKAYRTAHLFDRSEQITIDQIDWVDIETMVAQRDGYPELASQLDTLRRRRGIPPTYHLIDYILGAARRQASGKLTHDQIDRLLVLSPSGSCAIAA
jgi:hypothetical protein